MVENAFKNASESSTKAKDPETQALLMKKKTQGNVRFIGELLKVGIITAKMIQNCVETLLWADESQFIIDEDKIEGACILISTAGACFEKPMLVEETNKIFAHLSDFVLGNEEISSKIKFKAMVIFK